MLLVAGLVLLPMPALAFPDSLAIELQTTLGASSTWVGDSQFSGQGTLLTTHEMASFQATGKDLGLNNPWQTMVGFRLNVVIGRYLGIGAGIAWRVFGGPDGPPTNQGLAAQLDLNAMNANRYDAEVTGILPLGPLSLRLGLNVGYRHLGVPIITYDLVSCGKTRCPPDAEQSGVALGPRLWLTAPVFPGGLAQVFGYAGADVLPPYGFSSGVGVMMHMPVIQAAPK